MSSLNPFVPAILPSAQAQRQQAAERVGSARRAQEARRVTTQGQPSDTFEHQVESSDVVAESKDQERKRQRQNQHSRPSPDEQSNADSDEETPPHLDITG